MWSPYRRKAPLDAFQREIPFPKVSTGVSNGRKFGVGRMKDRVSHTAIDLHRLCVVCSHVCAPLL